MTDSTMLLLHVWCHVKLLPSGCMFCSRPTPYNHAPVYSVTSFEATLHECGGALMTVTVDWGPVQKNEREE